MPNFAPILTSIALLNFACLAGVHCAEESRDTAAMFSLADDFSYTGNGIESAWSYRLDDFATPSPAFPLLPLATRDANALWGSDFTHPPLMWCEASGYCGKEIRDVEDFVSGKAANDSRPQWWFPR